MVKQEQRRRPLRIAALTLLLAWTEANIDGTAEISPLGNGEAILTDDDDKRSGCDNCDNAFPTNITTNTTLTPGFSANDEEEGEVDDILDDDDDEEYDEEDDFEEDDLFCYEEDGEEFCGYYDDEEEEEEEEDGRLEYHKEETPFNEYTVAGVNLADYGKQAKFQLYEDFDISYFVQGDDSWEDMLSYRRELERPSLSFYVDKVARKRWLPTVGYNQPRLHALYYAEELDANADFSSRTEAILHALPVNHSYAAKPTHKSLTEGNWLVDHNLDGTTRFSKTAMELTRDYGEFDAVQCASSLAQGLDELCDPIESWALKNVKPGLVVEERWHSHEDPNVSPHEFCIFTIWGRVWAAQWNYVTGQNRYWNAFLYRNGTMAYGVYEELPDWVPWAELVQIAEELGAHKDMFRTDIFVGHPSTAGKDEPLQIAVSESEIHPTTLFENEDFTEEGARLWVAGYVMNVYETVPNQEVPAEFLYTGKLSPLNYQ